MSIPNADMRKPKVRARGLSLRSFLDTYESLKGPVARSTLVSSLSSDLREGLTFRSIISGGFYPLEWHIELHEKACAQSGRDADFSTEIGFTGVKRDLRGPVSFLLRFISIENAFHRSVRVWNSYWDSGEVIIVASNPGFIHLQFAQCYGFTHHLWHNVIGGCLAIIDVAGGQDATCDTLPKSGPADSFACFFTWQF